MALSNIQLSPQLVQAVRDAADVVAIAAEHSRLRKAGRRMTGLCPLHKEKTPSFSVDPEQGLFYCFGCGAGGDAIKLHMLLSGDDFPAAIESLARRHGIPIPPSGPRRRSGPGAPEDRDLEAVLDAAQEFFARELERAPGPQTYLERRKVPAEARQRFGIGYAPDDWRRLVGALHPRFPMGDLEAAGLVARPEGGGDPYDRFRHRLMFPIRNASGRLAGFGGRTLGDDKAKYINTAETDRFHKGHLLYGLDQAKRAIRESGKALLVEGYFDVLAAVLAGVEDTVASMGTALTPEQARLLARYSDEVIVGYDGDEAGEAASRRALELLLAEGLGVRRARFGAGEDPDSLRLARGTEAVALAVAEAPDLVALELDRLIPPEVQRHPRLRAKAASAVAELLKPIRDGILRYGYGRVAADRLGVPVDLLWRRLGVDKTAIRRVQNDGDSGFSTGKPQRTGLITSLEERTLQLLLAASEPAPDPSRLPPAEAFLDPVARNIFAAIARLYQEGVAPEPRRIVAGLSAEGAAGGAAIDRMAQLLLQDPVSGRPGELEESLRQLTKRFQQQKLRELAREINEAQRTGDEARLESVLREKTRLSRELHQI